jgi:hypothetical protein
MFSVVGFGLRSGKTLGIAFRSRFIARRHEEPVLFWMSLAVFAAFGAVALLVALSNLRLMTASM